MALYLLSESPSGYALFEAHGIDEIGQNTEAVRSSVSDLSRFGRVVQLTAFQPFQSALDALNQASAVSEDTFHDVRSKKEKRKENIVPIIQTSGRCGRRNFASSSSKTYQGNGRSSASFRRENGAAHATGGSKTALPATNKATNITVPSEMKYI